MKRKRGLTDIQRKVYKYLRVCWDMHHMASTREIQEKFGWASQTAARNHLSALASKGYISIMSGVARGIRILKFEDD